MTAKKMTRKTAAKKTATKPTQKSVRKKAPKKTTAKRKSPKKKSASARRPRIDLSGSELPKSLKAFGRELRRDLSALERLIESAHKDARRGLARVVRDASHQLGVLEAHGEKGWRSLSKSARHDIDLIMKRVRKAVLG